MKKKKESAEEFVGWKSEDGLIEVVELIEKSRVSKFKVICHKCKEDKELFPLGYFICNKGNLKKGRKPCRCSGNAKWTKEQHLILAQRAAEGRFVVHGFSEEFHGQNTKVNLECLVDGHKWSASLTSIVHSKSGCPKCSNKYHPTEKEVLAICNKICSEHNYTFIGFPDKYKGAKSRLEYHCPKHGIQNVKYDHFINSGSRCRGCALDETGFNGYYPERKDEQDFLYVLDFDSEFIKVGRSFDVSDRLDGLSRSSKVPIKKIHKLRIFTATHQEVYDTEQALLEELRERGFQYYLNWTKECFETGSLFVLNNLLDICRLQELPIE